MLEHTITAVAEKDDSVSFYKIHKGKYIKLSNQVAQTLVALTPEVQKMLHIKVTDITKWSIDLDLLKLIETDGFLHFQCIKNNRNVLKMIYTKTNEPVPSHIDIINNYDPDQCTSRSNGNFVDAIFFGCEVDVRFSYFMNLMT